MSSRVCHETTHTLMESVPWYFLEEWVDFTLTASSQDTRVCNYEATKEPTDSYYLELTVNDLLVI